MRLIASLLLSTFLGLSIAAAKKVDSFEKSNLFYFDGVYVLDLHGTREEMMTAHGYFAKQNVKTNSPLIYFSQVMDKSLDEKFNSLSSKVISKTLDVLLKMKMNDEDEKAYKAFATGLDIPATTVFKALYYPDFGEMLAAIQYSKNTTAMEIPELGCSTFVVPKTNENPGLLFGRNLEFGGVGFFDRYPAVIYYHSTDAKDQPYIQLTSLGVPGTHTAYNQSGLMFSLHQLTSNQISPVGDLILNIVDEAARRAKTLAEARSIIESKKITTPWKIIVASEKENAGFVVEVTPKGKYFVDMQDFIAETNHANAKAIKADEFFVTHNYLQSTITRKTVLHNTLKAKSVVDVATAIDLLGSRNQKNSTENSFISLSKFSNIMSVLMSSKDRKVYFGVANRANTKPSSGAYVQFPLEFNVDFEKYKASAHRSTKVYATAVLDVDNYIRAAMLENSQNADLNIVVDYLRKAVDVYGTDPNLNHVYAGNLLKLYAIGEGKNEALLNEALSVIEKTKSLISNENEKSVNSFLMARVSMLKNKKDEADGYYKQVVPTTVRMKTGLDNDLKMLKSADFVSEALKRTKKLKVTLTDLDIVDF